MLKDFLKSRGISLYKCAKDTGIPYSTLFEFSSGANAPDNTSMAIYEKLSSYLYLPIDMLYRISKGENIMKEIKTDDMAMKAEIYTELINDMQARIYEYSKETGGHLSKEITDLNKQLSYAHTESRIYVDEEHFKKWDALILSAKAAIIKDKMFV